MNASSQPPAHPLPPEPAIKFIQPQHHSTLVHQNGPVVKWLSECEDLVLQFMEKVFPSPTPEPPSPLLLALTHQRLPSLTHEGSRASVPPPPGSAVNFPTSSKMVIEAGAGGRPSRASLSSRSTKAVDQENEKVTPKPIEEPTTLNDINDILEKLSQIMTHLSPDLHAKFQPMLADLIFISYLDFAGADLEEAFKMIKKFKDKLKSSGHTLENLDTSLGKLVDFVDTIRKFSEYLAPMDQQFHRSPRQILLDIRGSGGTYVPKPRPPKPPPTVLPTEKNITLPDETELTKSKSEDKSKVSMKKKRKSPKSKSKGSKGSSKSKSKKGKKGKGSKKKGKKSKSKKSKSKSRSSTKKSKKGKEGSKSRKKKKSKSKKGKRSKSKSGSKGSKKSRSKSKGSKDKKKKTGKKESKDRSKFKGKKGKTSRSKSKTKKGKKSKSRSPEHAGDTPAETQKTSTAKQYNVAVQVTPKPPATDVGIDPMIPGGTGKLPDLTPSKQTALTALMEMTPDDLIDALISKFGMKNSPSIRELLLAKLGGGDESSPPAKEAEPKNKGTRGDRPPKLTELYPRSRGPQAKPRGDDCECPCTGDPETSCSLDHPSGNKRITYICPGVVCPHLTRPPWVPPYYMKNPPRSCYSKYKCSCMVSGSGGCPVHTKMARESSKKRTKDKDNEQEIDDERSRSRSKGKGKDKKEKVKVKSTSVADDEPRKKYKIKHGKSNEVSDFGVQTDPYFGEPRPLWTGYEDEFGGEYEGEDELPPDLGLGNDYLLNYESEEYPGEEGYWGDLDDDFPKAPKSSLQIIPGSDDGGPICTCSDLPCLPDQPSCSEAEAVCKCVEWLIQKNLAKDLAIHLENQLKLQKEERERERKDSGQSFYSNSGGGGGSQRHSIESNRSGPGSGSGTMVNPPPFPPVIDPKQQKKLSKDQTPQQPQQTPPKIDLKEEENPLGETMKEAPKPTKGTQEDVDDSDPKHIGLRLPGKFKYLPDPMALCMECKLSSVPEGLHEPDPDPESEIPAGCPCSEKEKPKRIYLPGCFSYCPETRAIYATCELCRPVVPNRAQLRSSFGRGSLPFKPTPSATAQLNDRFKELYGSEETPEEENKEHKQIMAEKFTGGQILRGTTAEGGRGTGFQPRQPDSSVQPRRPISAGSNPSRSGSGGGDPWTPPSSRPNSVSKNQCYEYPQDEPRNDNDGLDCGQTCVPVANFYDVCYY